MTQSRGHSAAPANPAADLAADPPADPAARRGRGPSTRYFIAV